MGRKTAWLLVAVAIWNFIIWGTFIKNLAASHSSGEDRPGGYYVAHSVLIVVNMVLGAVFAVIGIRALRHRP